MSLCFHDAFIALRDQTITEKEYFGHLVAHCRGVRHSCDNHGPFEITKASDPFGLSVRKMALETDYKPFEGSDSNRNNLRRMPISLRYFACVDTSLYEILFQSCVTGSVDEINSSLQLIEQKALPLPLQPLATLAARKGAPEVLQLCFDRGAQLSLNIMHAAKLAGPNHAVNSIISKYELPKEQMDEQPVQEPNCCFSSKQLAE